eukprot:gene14140-4149_t
MSSKGMVHRKLKTTGEECIEIWFGDSAPKPYLDALLPQRDGVQKIEEEDYVIHGDIGEESVNLGKAVCVFQGTYRADLLERQKSVEIEDEASGNSIVGALILIAAIRCIITEVLSSCKGHWSLSATRDALSVIHTNVRRVL